MERRPAPMVVAGVDMHRDMVAGPPLTARCGMLPPCRIVPLPGVPAGVADASRSPPPRRAGNPRDRPVCQMTTSARFVVRNNARRSSPGVLVPTTISGLRTGVVLAEPPC